MIAVSCDSMGKHLIESPMLYKPSEDGNEGWADDGRPNDGRPNDGDDVES